LLLLGIVKLIVDFDKVCVLDKYWWLDVTQEVT